MADQPFDLFYLPFRPALDANGIVVPGASLTFYVSGTSTPQTIYADAGLTTPLANPVTANAAGAWPAIYIDNSLTYRVVLRNGVGAVLNEVDPYVPGMIGGPAGDTGPADNTYTSYAAMQASDPTRQSARLVGDTDTPPHADGPYNNPTKTLGGWVPQGADGIQFIAKVPGAEPTQVSEELDSFGVRPEAFGATGTMLSDDTSALQAALDTGLNIRLTPGRAYHVSSKLVWNANNVSLAGGGTIKVLPWNFANDPGGGAGNHLRVLFVNGENCKIEGITWDATGITPGTGIENGFIWCTGPYLTVTGCVFLGLGKGTCVWGLSSFTGFNSNLVRNCTGAIFVRGRGNTIGLNRIINATDAAIALNGQTCVDTTVIGNAILNEQGAEIPAMIAVEEGAGRWVISGNEMIGVAGGGVQCVNVLDGTSVEGGIISDNEIDARLPNGNLPTVVNPAALLAVRENYRGTKIHGNKIYGIPNGPNNSRLVIIPATETEFYDNTVDTAGATGSANGTNNILALVDVIAGNGGLTIRNNKIAGFAGVRLVFINAGNYAGAALRFVGGRYLNGAEAINGELAVASIMGLKIYLRDIDEVTSTSFINAPTTIGYRGDALNTGAWKRPHRIGEMTDMFVPSIPTGNGGTMGIAPGDTVQLMDPGYPSGTKGYVYTANGAVWRPWGSI